MEEDIKIDLQEIIFITLNAENTYKELKEITTTSDSDPLYTLTALSILSAYRNTLEIEIEDTLLYFYKETIKAIINEDEAYLSRLQKILGGKHDR